MSFSILDLVIGMIFIYFLLSIICSSAADIWFTFRRTRGKLLEEWLKRIFNLQALDSSGVPIVDSRGRPKTVGVEIMDHCMTTALAKEGKATAYISAQTFVSALLDKITISPSQDNVGNVVLPPETLDEYINSIKKSNCISGELKRVILTLAYEAKAAWNALRDKTDGTGAPVKSDLDHFRQRLENWYDLNGDRLTGNFKRKKVLPLTFVLAIIITISLNVDTIAISKYLYTNKEEARQFADKTITTFKNYDDRLKKDSASLNSDPDKAYNQLKKDVDSLKAIVPVDLPLGWAGDKQNWKKHIPGWLATILAIVMGAPFWFDLLNKIANIRGAGPKPLPSKDDEKNK